MKEEELKSHREEGIKVWQAVLNQMAEGTGFLHAMLISFRHFIKKQFFSFLIYAIIGGLIAGAIWYVKPKVYEAGMTVSYIHYEKKIYADMLAKLDRLATSKSSKALSSLLDIPEDVTSNLASIRGYNIRGEELTEDLSTERIPFYINVKVLDVEILPELQSAIVNYLDGTDFIQDRLNYMRQKSEDELRFLELRLSVVDSLSKILFLKEDKMLGEKTVTRMELLEETLTLFDKIQEVKGSLAFNHNIEVLDGFVANDKPSGKGMVVWIAYGLLAGIALRFLVLIFS
jgi:hypothetical protein